MNNRRNPSFDDAAAPLDGDAAQRIADLERRLQDVETALLRSKAKQRMAMEVGKLGAWERDLATNELTANAVFKAHFGLAEDEPLTLALLDGLKHPADIERIDQAVKYALATRSDFHVEHRIIRPDGSLGRILVRGAALYENDRPVRLVGVTQDVTERDKAKEELQEAQRRQEFLLTLNDRFGRYEDPHEIMDAAVQSLGRLLKVDAAGYGEVQEDGKTILIQREWSTGIIGNEGRACHFDQLPPYDLELMWQGKPITIEDVGSDAKCGDPTSQNFSRTAGARTGPRTGLGAPLLKNAQLKAVLYLISSAPRIWSSEDIALVEDVAERTWTAVAKARAELSLRESETRFRTITEALPGIVWIVTRDLELTYTNERWVEFSGLPRERALGHSWMSTIHPDDVAKLVKDAEIIRATGASYEAEVRYRSIDGEYRWHLMKAAPLYDAWGGFKGWVGTSVDIHDIKETDAALRKSEERLALAQRAARVGVFDMDISRRTVTWTVEQERLFGIEPGSFEGTYEAWVSRIPPADAAAIEKNFAEAVARGDREMPFAYRIPLPDGTVRFIEGSQMIFYGEDGSPARLIGVNIDVTKHKQAEERQQLLIRELHHRVKNTLATVQAIVGSTARTATSIDEFYQGFVGRIVSLARTHNLLTEDLWQKASLEDLILTELGPYEDEARNRVVVEGPAVELPSEAAVPVGMAIHELTTNAAKHGALSTFGGQVEVKWHIESGGDRPMLHFFWTERGGPRVAHPERQGFGSRLLKRVLATQLQADVNMDFHSDGIHFKMTMPIPKAPSPSTRITEP